MLCCDHLMIVQYAVERSVDAVVEEVHNRVQFTTLTAHFPLGMDLTDQRIGSSHKVAARLGNNLNTFISEVFLHRLVYNASGLRKYSIYNIIYNLYSLY